MNILKRLFHHHTWERVRVYIIRDVEREEKAQGLGHAIDLCDCGAVRDVTLPPWWL